VLARGKEKTALAAQIATVGNIIDGAADIEPGDFLVTLIPVIIEQRTDG
jgi:hypothetical protein